jgi:hypothetical protein
MQATGMGERGGRACQLGLTAAVALQVQKGSPPCKEQANCEATLRDQV